MAPEAVWFGWGLKGRDCGGTYEQYPLNDLPSVTPFKQLEHIKVPADIPDQVKKIIEAVSFTSCYFESNDPEKHDFFRDQQGCVVWCFDPDTGHVVVGSKVVAYSLAEFLSRVLIESYGPKTFAPKNMQRKGVKLTSDDELFLADITVAASQYLSQLPTSRKTPAAPKSFWEAFHSGIYPSWQNKIFDFNKFYIYAKTANLSSVGSMAKPAATIMYANR